MQSRRRPDEEENIIVYELVTEPKDARFGRGRVRLRRRVSRQQVFLLLVLVRDVRYSKE